MCQAIRGDTSFSTVIVDSDLRRTYCNNDLRMEINMVKENEEIVLY